MRPRELVEQARLPHARLADDSHELTVSSCGLLQAPSKLLDLGVAADEVAQTAGE